MHSPHVCHLFSLPHSLPSIALIIFSVEIPIYYLGFPLRFPCVFSSIMAAAIRLQHLTGKEVNTLGLMIYIK